MNEVTEESPQARPAPALLARIFANAGRLLGGQVASGIASFLAVAIVARALGTAGYGALLLVHSCAMSFSTATRLQSWQPLLNFGPALLERRDHGALHSLLRHCLVLDFGGAALGLVLAVPGVALLGAHLGWPPADQPLALLYMTAILFMNTSGAMGVLRLTDRFGQVMMGDVASAWCKVLGSAIGFLLHWSFGAYLAVWYVAVVAGCMTDHILAWRALRQAGAMRGFALTGAPWLLRGPDLWRPVLATSADKWLFGLESRVTLLLLGGILGPAPTAVFSVTRDVCDALGQPAQFLAPALYPELIRLRDSRDWAAIRQMTRRILLILAGFCALAIAVAALAGPPIIGLVLGDERKLPFTLLLLLAGTSLMDLWDAPLEPLLLSLGRASVLFRGRLAATLVGLPAFYVAARLWGLTGAGSASLMAETLVLLSRLIPARAALSSRP
nr:lipopolysaccharide biosynthesis protein [Acidomonas methanolica]